MEQTKSKCWLAILGVLGCALALPGCASRQELPPADFDKSVERPLSQPVGGVVPERGMIPAVGVVTRREEPDAARRRPLAARDRGDWTTRLANGRVVARDENGVLRFEPHHPPRRATALFEDSILQSRARGALRGSHQIYAVPHELRVHRGVATLRFAPDVSSLVLTEAVDKVLAVPGLHALMLVRSEARL